MGDHGQASVFSVAGPNDARSTAPRGGRGFPGVAAWDPTPTVWKDFRLAERFRCNTISDFARDVGSSLASLTLAFLIANGCCKGEPLDPPQPAAPPQPTASEIWRTAIGRYPALAACIVPSELAEYLAKDLPLQVYHQTAELDSEPSTETVSEPSTTAIGKPSTDRLGEPRAEATDAPSAEALAEPNTEKTPEPDYRLIAGISRGIIDDGCSVSVLEGPEREIYVILHGGFDGSTQIQIGPFAPDASDF